LPPAGKWRTNVALGGGRTAADPPPQARLIALGAAAALGADFVGVDLLPDGDGRWVVLEVNGAVDFTSEYSLGGESVFKRVVQTLARSVRGDTESSGERLGRFLDTRLRGTAIASAAEEAVMIATAYVIAHERRRGRER
jgi:RimK-like ATP-grasp domain